VVEGEQVSDGVSAKMPLAADLCARTPGSNVLGFAIAEGYDGENRAKETETAAVCNGGPEEGVRRQSEKKRNRKREYEDQMLCSVGKTLDKQMKGKDRSIHLRNAWSGVEKKYKCERFAKTTSVKGKRQKGQSFSLKDPYRPFELKLLVLLRGARASEIGKKQTSVLGVWEPGSVTVNHRTRYNSTREDEREGQCGRLNSPSQRKIV